GPRGVGGGGRSAAGPAPRPGDHRAPATGQSAAAGHRGPARPAPRRQCRRADSTAKLIPLLAPPGSFPSRGFFHAHLWIDLVPISLIMRGYVLPDSGPQQHSGSSPHTRGAPPNAPKQKTGRSDHRRRRRAELCARIIPAYAGSTLSISSVRIEI